MANRCGVFDEVSKYRLKQGYLAHFLLIAPAILVWPGLYKARWIRKPMAEAQKPTHSANLNSGRMEASEKQMLPSSALMERWSPERVSHATASAAPNQTQIRTQFLATLFWLQWLQLVTFGYRIRTKHGHYR